VAFEDITNLPVGSLGTDDAVAINTPSPTIVMLFVTGHGLCALSGWLKREWETAAKPFAVVTCVEALDTCVDLISIGGSNDGGGNPLFDQALNPHDWDVYRDTTHAKYGVFVTPPRGISVTEWRNQKVTPAPADPESAKKHAPRLVKNALDETTCPRLRRWWRCFSRGSLMRLRKIQTIRWIQKIQTTP